jgi:hypothetical protein
MLACCVVLHYGYNERISGYLNHPIILTEQKLPDNETKNMCTRKSEEIPKEYSNTRRKIKTDC